MCRFGIFEKVRGWMDTMADADALMGSLVSKTSENFYYILFYVLNLRIYSFKKLEDQWKF